MPGPPPKDPATRARRNADPIPTTVLEFHRGVQPALPVKMPNGEKWPTRTRAWWKRWAEDPRAEHFDQAAWDDLLDTAVIHGAYWSGELKLAGELRLRVANYGVTPADRARLRITFADANRADGGKSASGPTARERRGTLHALPPAATS